MIQTNGNGNGQPAAFAPGVGLVIPGIAFDKDEYAAIKVRLDMYDDFILATKYDNHGRSGATFAVDPADLAASVSDLSVSTGLMSKNILFWSKKGSVERVGVYLEPQVWPLSVSGHKLTWHIPLPGMIFIGQRKAYSLYAVKEYPAPKTTLYKAPVPNLNNSVCTGNVTFPHARINTIGQAIEAFFQSGFNNHLSQDKSQKHPDNILKMWEALKGVSEYPLDDLVPAQKAIKKIVEVQ